MAEIYRELDWEDRIAEEGGGGFTLLPDGDYRFEIVSFERARFAGSSKVPACAMAKVKFKIKSDDGDIEIVENYFLYTKFEWKLSQLFLAVGLKKHGEPLQMKWNRLAGCTGVAQIYVDEYSKNDGSTGRSNKIRKLYAYDEQPQIAAPTAAPAVQAQGWTPGSF